MSSSIPRISPEQLPPELASFLKPRVERLGYLGEFFQCTAHQPEALLSFLELAEHLKHALPGNLTEVVSLTTAKLMDNAYERVQHERLSLKLGFSAEWILGILRVTPDAALELSVEEREVQRLAIAVVERNGHHAKVELETVIRLIGVPKTIAVLMLVGRYMSHAVIVNALNLAPPVSSPFAEVS
jgi:alkylhydroperoxidase family enzyme